MILQPTSISSSFFYAFFPLNQPSWRQIHERSEKIYYPGHWRYQYFSYNKSSPNSLNCVHYLIMTKKRKSVKAHQWMMTTANSFLVLSWHFWMTFCWQKGVYEMLSSGVNSAAQTLAHCKFYTQRARAHPERTTYTRKYVVGVIILLACLPPPQAQYIHPSVTLSRKGWFKLAARNAHTHTRAMLC